MKYIKEKNQITLGYCQRLAEWIKENPNVFFAKDNEAESWYDFNYWPHRKTDRNHLILTGEIFVADRMWEERHAYVVCQLRKNGCRDLYRVIFVDELNRSDWRNGYFLIPDLDSLDRDLEGTANGN